MIRWFIDLGVRFCLIKSRISTHINTWKSSSILRLRDTLCYWMIWILYMGHCMICLIRGFQIMRERSIVVSHSRISKRQLQCLRSLIALFWKKRVNCRPSPLISKISYLLHWWTDSKSTFSGLEISPTWVLLK